MKLERPTGKLRIRYTYVRGIQEIKKAWRILQEGRVGIGRIAHSLLEQSTPRKPVTLKQIAADSEINYSTLKTYYGFYVDIIRHLPKAKQKTVTTTALGRTSKRLNKLTGTSYEKVDRFTRTNYEHTGRRTEGTRAVVVPEIVNRIYTEERERTKASLKLESALRKGYETINFLREYRLTASEIAKFRDFRTAFEKEMQLQEGRL